jgi:SAM-dependent methyltransferase
LQRLWKKIKNILGNGTNDNVHAAKLIEKYVFNKSFVDVGCMWNINGAFCFDAEKFGAKRIVGVDVYPESEEFLTRKKECNSKIEFIQGDINSQDTIDKIGQCDVVFCSGVLYHLPAPEYLLVHLRMICKEILILRTMIIPEIPGIKNAAVFYPFLSDQQRNIWNLKIGIQKAITAPYEPENGYGNWFWGLTPSCVEALLNLAGFNVTERYIDFFQGTFVCKRAEVKFLPVSGVWITPNDEDFVKFKR